MTGGIDPGSVTIDSRCRQSPGPFGSISNRPGRPILRACSSAGRWTISRCWRSACSRYADARIDWRRPAPRPLRSIGRSIRPAALPMRSGSPPSGSPRRCEARCSAKQRRTQAIDPDVAMLLREALSAARTLMMHGLSEGKNSAVHAPALVDGLRRPCSGSAFRRLPRICRLTRSTPIGRLLQQAEGETAFLARTPDMLTEADDRDVIDALARHMARASPLLPSCRAGWRRRAPMPGIGKAPPWPRPRSPPACTLASRNGRKPRSVAGGRHQPASAGGRPGEKRKNGLGEGFAALESPRGRLYHWLQASAERQVAAYAILAPTEWNFHPRGPLLEALVGAEIGTGEEARRRVSRLVAVFDPCVSFDVRVQEAANA